MATIQYLDLNGLKTFKSKQDVFNEGKFWQKTETVNSAYQVGNIIAVKRSTAYTVGDIRVAEGLPGGLYLKCTTAGTSSADSIDFSSAVTGGTVTDGTVTWTVGSIESVGSVAEATRAAYADVADKLSTAHTINGVPFDGTSDITINAVDSTPRIAESEKGAANGVATLGEDGKVPSDQLPSYVDDVLSYENKDSFPATGETGKIYLAEDTNLIYRWATASSGEGGSYIEVGSSASTADAAVKLATARNFSITGAAVASAVSFDGSADVALNVTSLDATKLTGTVPESCLDIEVIADTDIEDLFSGE